MDNLTPQQKKKLLRLAKVADRGEVALIEELDDIEEKLDSILLEVESKIEEVKSLIPSVKDGKSIKRDSYILTSADN